MNTPEATSTDKSNKSNKPNSNGKIRIFEKNALKGPIFETSDANTIIMYDENDEPCVLLTRLVNNTWVMGSKADDDWEAVKANFGVM